LVTPATITLRATDQYGGGMSESVSSPPGLDLPAVLRWLSTNTDEAIDPGATARLIAGGRSNLTYLVDDGRRRFVVRRPPLGHVLATAHDMGREYRIISSLAGTAVPVPATFGLCPDPEVTGAPFYAMSFVDGLVVRADVAEAEGLTEPDRHQLAASMMTVLADLHEVDVEAVGLADFGRPAGFLGRQLSRWSKQLDASRSREIVGIDQLRDDLGARVPETGARTGIVHGDYRLDNLIVAPRVAADALSVRAVLDWEMATLGDPLTDLGLLLAYWDVLSAMDSTVVQNVGSAQGFPDGATLTGWYQDRRDADLGELPWYVAFGLFKLAVILEGIHYRHQLGQTVGADFAQIGAGVPNLVSAGQEILAGHRE
jgi:aminoglycoside phosphotransferase (APT) family kinase protein